MKYLIIFHTFRINNNSTRENVRREYFILFNKNIITIKLKIYPCISACKINVMNLLILIKKKDKFNDNFIPFDL